MQAEKEFLHKRNNVLSCVCVGGGEAMGPESEVLYKDFTISITVSSLASKTKLFLEHKIFQRMVRTTGGQTEEGNFGVVAGHHMSIYG